MGLAVCSSLSRDEEQVSLMESRSSKVAGGGDWDGWQGQNCWRVVIWL